MGYPVGINPLPSVAFHEVTIDLSSILTNSAVNMGNVYVADTIYVQSLTGSCTMRINGTTESAITLSSGEARDFCAAEKCYISTAGNAGWSITLQFQGKPLSPAVLS